jgi:hypothetical protein
MWSRLQGHDFDIKDILESGRFCEFCNDQVRIISGTPAIQIGESEFKTCCDNINRFFGHVGTLERFDNGLRAMATQNGWDHSKPDLRNPGDYSDFGILPNDAIDAFRFANYWDRKLYEWVATSL